MSKVLFLSMPSHGHMNPTLGLAKVLVAHGEEVTFFSSAEFKAAVEEIGATFKCYKEDLNIFKQKQAAAVAAAQVKTGVSGEAEAAVTDQKRNWQPSGLAGTLLHPEKFIDAILEEIDGLKFDYLLFSAAYPFAAIIARILNIPSISSFAVFATLDEMAKSRGQNKDGEGKRQGMFGANPELLETFKTVRQNLMEKYQVEISENLLDFFVNKGDLNIIYTSKYFIANPDSYDDSFIFIGPPVYNKKYQVEFPFEKLAGKRVIYISMGTIFSNHSVELNKLFFKSFADMDVVVVMAAYEVDVSQYEIPANFIIRDYVPQLELLKYTSVAITHSGMNSIGDLLYHNVPFVSIPLGADQFYLADRAQELGATVVLEAGDVTTAQLRAAVEKVSNDPSYLENIKKISASFREAGGYERAAAEIARVKREKGISFQQGSGL